MDNVLERIEELEKQRTALVEEAKADALQSAETAIAVLQTLGLDYKLVTSRTAGKTVRKKRAPCSDKVCPICAFQTDPPHDARRHRGQQEKAPFSAEELKAKGLKRIPNLADATDAKEEGHVGFDTDGFVSHGVSAVQ